ncbi:DNA polymerase III subunit gamma/tau [Glaciecola sp. 1036]|uniref:DNA polymerase III subunit gamma/tau n=1 Tax=Alteromonadaceae TaxID=72275 RepID=UPI003D03DEE2
MSYQVLARKWRPRTFTELVGQHHVVAAITNALENDRLHHAYLFTGTRGVGKTTIARIFAKSLNCEQGQSANPCGKCDTCQDINQGRYVDLLEIDAASRTKVEDTRELLDNVQYKPTRGKYKVYLIDEVHMLSKHSFNALLKTLEEPPPHVKFLLATTDPQKLPVTILSRCLQFNLKALSREQIHKQLATILSEENVAFEDAGLLQLARAANGSMRDALSLTDQAIAQGNNQVSLSVVTHMLGLLDRNLVLKLVKAVFERSGPDAMQQLSKISQDAPDYSQVLSQIMASLHQISLTQIVPEVCKLDSGSAKAIYTLSKAASPEHVQMLYQIALNGKRDIAFAPDPFSGLQMTILRMLAFSPEQKIELNIDDLVAPSSNFEEPETHSPRGQIPAATQIDTQSAAKPEQQEQQPQVNQNIEDSQPEAVPEDIPQEPEMSAPPELPNEYYEQQEYSEQASDSEEFQTSNLEQTGNKDVQDLEKTISTISLFDDLEESDSKGEEAPIDSVKKPEAQSQPVSIQTIVGSETKPISAVLPNGDKLLVANQIDQWSHFIDELDVKALARQLLIHSNLVRFETDLVIRISLPHQHLNVEASRKSIEEALYTKYGRQIALIVELGEVEDTPFELQTKIDAMRQQHAESVVQNDQIIQELIKVFDANIIQGSIQPRPANKE